jgi:chitosanase
MCGCADVQMCEWNVSEQAFNRSNCSNPHNRPFSLCETTPSSPTLLRAQLYTLIPRPLLPVGEGENEKINLPSPFGRGAGGEGENQVSNHQPTIMITQSEKQKIQKIVSVFETGSAIPRYSTLVVLPDGPRVNGIRSLQITYGRFQVTEFGNLRLLIRMYCNSNGLLAELFQPYLPIIMRRPLHNDIKFKKLLKAAAQDDVMQKTQDDFFDKYYWDPAFMFFKKNGFTLPLSMLVIFDSYIHSGGVPSWLRDDFKELPPARGGYEKDWIKAYVRTRDRWLEEHSDYVLRNTDYRTDCLLDLIRKEDWQLKYEAVVKFNSAGTDNWVTV